ncbi:MAG: hypothetical protein ACQETL_19900 [Bacteroidota bacterium]
MENSWFISVFLEIPSNIVDRGMYPRFIKGFLVMGFIPNHPCPNMTSTSQIEQKEEKS